MAGLIAVSLFTGSYVRPVIKGFDAIYAKPVAREIQKIAADDKEGNGSRREWSDSRPILWHAERPRSIPVMYIRIWNCGKA